MTGSDAPVPSVAVVTVTYGSRWGSLFEVLSALTQTGSPVADIVVVDNGSDYDVRERAEPLDARIHVVRLAGNAGSAVGFRVGIATACERQRGELIWLLDDDNRPRSDALARLIACFQSLGSSTANAVAAIRPDLREFVLAATGLMRIRIPPNSFLGFHAALIPEKAMRRVRARNTAWRDEARMLQRVDVQYVPYGGLLFHRDWVTRIGLPREDFYLYADDYEFTSRIPAAGGRIVLCPGAKVEDLEKSWHQKPGRSHVYFARDANLRRLYYSIRNGVFLERSRFVSSAAVYWMNRVVYLAALTAYSLFVDRDPWLSFGRLRLLVRAMHDGDRGRLGRVMEADWHRKLGSGAY